MANLVKDVWFWISAVGFCVSSGLFVYLLSQYKRATGVPERHEPAEEAVLPVPKPVSAPVPVKAAGAEKTLVLGPSEMVSKPVAPVPAPVPAPSAPPPPAPAPAPAPVVAAPVAAPLPAQDAAAAQKKAETTTGGISPAVVYMQNIKSQLDRLDKDVAAIKALLSKQGIQEDTILGQEGLILKRLDELSAQVKTAAAAQAAAQAYAPLAAPGVSGAAVPPPSSTGGGPPAPAPTPEPGIIVDKPREFVEEPPEGKPHEASLDALLAGSFSPDPAPEPAPPAPEPEVALPNFDFLPPAPAPAPALGPPSGMTLQLDVPPALSGLSAAPPAALELPPAPPPPPPPAPLAKEENATIRLPNPTPMVLDQIPDKPAEPPETKPTRKGPVWPI